MEILDVSLGVAYVVGTYGSLDANMTAGLGWAYVKEKHEKFQIGKTPVTLLGGYLRTSEISALLFEAWAYPSSELSVKNLPIFFGVRLFGSAHRSRCRHYVYRQPPRRACDYALVDCGLQFRFAAMIVSAH